VIRHAPRHIKAHFFRGKAHGRQRQIALAIADLVRARMLKNRA
jgi:hypothetical protein